MTDENTHDRTHDENTLSQFGFLSPTEHVLKYKNSPNQDPKLGQRALGCLQPKKSLQRKKPLAPTRVFFLPRETTKKHTETPPFGSARKSFWSRLRLRLGLAVASVASAPGPPRAPARTRRWAPRDGRSPGRCGDSAPGRGGCSEERRNLRRILVRVWLSEGSQVFG